MSSLSDLMRPVKERLAQRRAERPERLRRRAEAQRLRVEEKRRHESHPKAGGGGGG